VVDIVPEKVDHQLLVVDSVRYKANPRQQLWGTEIRLVKAMRAASRVPTPANVSGSKPARIASGSARLARMVSRSEAEDKKDLQQVQKTRLKLGTGNFSSWTLSPKIIVHFTQETRNFSSLERIF